MHRILVFEITIPGTWLDYKDRDRAWKIEGIIQNLESQFYEANLALNLFIQAKALLPAHFDLANEERKSRRKLEIYRMVEQERGVDSSKESWEAVRSEAELRFKREQWEQGRMPREFEHAQPLLFARAFLYALDAFDKFLGVLANEDGVPAEISNFHAQIAGTFPDLRGVRNTAQHLEDRARGLGAGKNPKPLELKPVVNQLINAPGGGALILNTLLGSRYGSTMADGHYGEIDVSPESMRQLQSILQGVLDSFRWRGPTQHSPHV